jgi:hypothetical protein
MGCAIAATGRAHALVDMAVCHACCRVRCTRPAHVLMIIQREPPSHAGGWIVAHALILAHAFVRLDSGETRANTSARGVRSRRVTVTVNAPSLGSACAMRARTALRVNLRAPVALSARARFTVCAPLPVRVCATPTGRAGSLRERPVIVVRRSSSVTTVTSLAMCGVVLWWATSASVHQGLLDQAAPSPARVSPTSSGTAAATDSVVLWALHPSLSTASVRAMQIFTGALAKCSALRATANSSMASIAPSATPRAGRVSVGTACMATSPALPARRARRCTGARSAIDYARATAAGVAVATLVAAIVLPVSLEMGRSAARAARYVRPSTSASTAR